MPRFVIPVDEDLHRRVRVKAATEGRAVAEVVRSLLTNWAVGSWAEARERHETTVTVGGKDVTDKVRIEEIIPRAIKASAPAAASLGVADKTIHVPPPSTPRPEPDPPPAKTAYASTLPVDPMIAQRKKDEILKRMKTK